MSVVMPNSRFLHMPKTGGMWVEKILLDCVVGARAVNYPERHCGIESCVCKWRFTFAFVRHPHQWYRSYWTYKMREGWDRANPFDMDCQSGVFYEFIDKVLRQYPRRYTYTCHAFVGMQGKEIDFIGRSENLRKDLRRALELAREELHQDTIDTAAPLNASKDEHREKAIYGVGQKRAIFETEREIFERFGYEPEEE